MKKEVYLTILFDYYEKLLSDSDRDVFKDYYFSNLSLGEISENNNISRAAVHKKLKKITEILYSYEGKLKMYDKEQRILNVLKNEDERRQIKEILND